MSDFFSCPNCGAAVPVNAKACPECGSDAETGWSEAARVRLPYNGDLEELGDRRRWQRYVVAGLATAILAVFMASQGLAWALWVVPLVMLFGWGLSWGWQVLRNTRWGMEQRLYQQLLERARGDRQLVARLLELERQRYPQTPRLQCLQNAIYRWDRDR
jgi:hypothetical protein